MVSPKVLPMLAILLAWNITCWFLAEVRASSHHDMK
jgi:hypothetical protein